MYSTTTYSSMVHIHFNMPLWTDEPWSSMCILGLIYYINQHVDLLFTIVDMS